MNILFVGDVVGRAGRRALCTHLANVQKEQAIDFTIVNVENAAGGYGITPPIAREILSYGVDAMTSGNHIWDKREIFDFFPTEPRLLRPGNYPRGLPGNWYTIAESHIGVPVAVANLQGRVFMPIIDCPFQMAERECARISKRAPVVLVDFHAEATSEKMAMGWFLDGHVSAVVGTHTHVPTADARVLPGGTAYVTDVGMTGPYDSIIGMKKEASLSRFLTGLPARFQTARHDVRFSSVVIEVDESTGKARSIRRLDREG